MYGVNNMGLKYCEWCGEEIKGEGKYFCGKSCCALHRNYTNNPAKSEKNRQRMREDNPSFRPEVKKKLSEMNKQFYKEHPELAKEMSEIMRRGIPKKRPREWVEKIANANRGQKRTPEQIKRQSEVMKGKLAGPKNPMYGKTHPPEIRKKISEKIKGKTGLPGAKNPMYGKNGHLNPNWRGGTSFGKYCPKFNPKFKERVREFWGRKCGICGRIESTLSRKLSVHHVNYEKMSCCNDAPPLFIPLCNACHTKTNFKREYWEHSLTEFIMIYFDGDSYNNI